MAAIFTFDSGQALKEIAIVQKPLVFHPTLFSIILSGKGELNSKIDTEDLMNLTQR
jgi:hypothetical protein